jgi:hypothetical protein
MIQIDTHKLGNYDYFMRIGITNVPTLHISNGCFWIGM